ncbi:nucleotide-binding protein [Acidisoma cellulosilytica]|uniref:Nucleotide-binding protein n=1 Tax=Acidisoma cellulosilyticum TaxID=2802395 RepID=A0A963Z7N4_9PROT|nr:nucleotide-binding protein [Acidisoma cellulosilyticum]MCB8884021.1 nucleotide-binding protein [Acidisoma cellulosilyticum]
MLTEASRALESLGGKITQLRFNPHDASSVAGAIVDMEQAINQKLRSYEGNLLVTNLANQMKAAYRQRILDRAAELRSIQETESMSVSENSQTLFRQIENTVSDLRRSEHTSFDRHIKKLSRLLHSQELEEITQQLASRVDLESWLAAGHATQGGFTGSAKLEWPSDLSDELGTVIQLVDRFSQEPREAINFSYTFYNAGNNITNNVQRMVAEVMIPFARDYIDYVKDRTGAVEATLIPQRKGPAARKVFVVHGHDNGAKEAVARFLTKIDFEPIILHEQANRGLTIIEKIESHSDVGFAVILLTPDDVGNSLKGAPQARARQNVILELGYFIGRLGRSRVCALKKESIEIPSDFEGVVYITFDDNDGWKTSLGRELDSAGFEIDWGKAMRP